MNHGNAEAGVPAAISADIIGSNPLMAFRLITPNFFTRLPYHTIIGMIVLIKVRAQSYGGAEGPAKFAPRADLLHAPRRQPWRRLMLCNGLIPCCGLKTDVRACSSEFQEGSISALRHRTV